MKTYIYILVVGFFTLAACTPQIDDKIELGNLPTASFNINEGATANDFILTNTSEGTFITKWAVDQLGSFSGDEVEISIPFKGEYNVTMTVFNDGGHASLSKIIEVTEDASGGCIGNMELLTNCDEKTWVLAPEASALHVGPSLFETWWGNSEDDVNARACHFNDQYIFRENGEYEYDNLGDFWADTDGNGNVTPADLGLPVGCNNASDWPDQYKVWDSGKHNFNITESNLTVSGTGAWLGLYKVGTSSEVSSPQESVSLQILEISEDRMVLYGDYGGLVWRLTFVSL